MQDAKTFSTRSCLHYIYITKSQYDMYTHFLYFITNIDLISHKLSKKETVYKREHPMHHADTEQ